MNNGKLCALVVMLCIITPIMIGYVWPTTTTEQNAYYVQNTKNVTADNAASIPIYQDFTDVYANNFNTFVQVPDTDDGTNALHHTTFSTGGPWTFQNNGFPQLDWTEVDSTVTTDGTKTATITNDLVTYIETNVPFNDPLYYVDIVLRSTSNSDYLTVSNENGTYYCKTVTYYPGSGIIQCVAQGHYYGGAMYALQITSSTELGIATYLANKTVQLQIYYNTPHLENGQVRYYDIYQDGLTMPYLTPPSGSYFDYSTWYNGYTNQAIDIIVGAPYYGQTVHLMLSDNNYNDNMTVYLSYDSDIKIRVTAYDANNNPTESKFDNNYSYYWIHIDTRLNELTVAGLSGFSSMSSDYEAAARETLTMDVICDPFSSIVVCQMDPNYNLSTVDWFIAKTVTTMSYQQGVEGYYDLKKYSNTSYSQLQLKYVTYWPVSGKGIQIFYNGSYHNALVTSDGYFEFAGIREKLEGLTIMNVGGYLYINGKNTNIGPYTNYGVNLNGGFLANVYFSDLRVETVDEYGWLPGGFGLDWSGFCIAGLITSGGSGIAASLYGRRSGGKVLLVGIVATICAAAYLVLLMGNL